VNPPYGYSPEENARWVQDRAAERFPMLETVAEAFVRLVLSEQEHG
jgi:hypothetical protein